MAKAKLTKKVICEAYASKIHKTNLTEAEILNTLHELWLIAWIEGYQKKCDERKKFKTSREATHKKEWGKQRDKIEDEIHGGIKQKTEA